MDEKIEQLKKTKFKITESNERFRIKYKDSNDKTKYIDRVYKRCGRETALIEMNKIQERLVNEWLAI